MTCIKTDKREEEYAVNLTEKERRGILYSAFKNMEYRCNNVKHKQYHHYGGRGITVSEEWQTFEAFYEWAIINGHKKGLTLERVDNDGDYEPANCTWATREEQNANRRSEHAITIDGVTRNAKDWCKVYDLNPETFYGRYNVYGWSIMKSLTTPVKVRKKPSGFKDRYNRM